MTVKMRQRQTATSTTAFLRYVVVLDAVPVSSGQQHVCVCMQPDVMPAVGACLVLHLYSCQSTCSALLQAVRGNGNGEGEDDNDRSVTFEDLAGQPDAEYESENLHPGKGWDLVYNLRSRCLCMQ